MIIGELKRLTRNRVFLIITAAIILANIVMIMYCANMSDTSPIFSEYMNEVQQEYIESYDEFVYDMEERGEKQLAVQKGDKEYFRKNIDKTVQDYEDLKGIEPDTEYNMGMDEYAEYSYGIFFCILFALACIEFLFFSERRNGMLNMLRTTRRGRFSLAFSKFCVFVVSVAIFTLVQEINTLIVYDALYSLGNVSSCVQSLSIFRDCPLRISMLSAICMIVTNRVILSAVAASVIFFFSVTTVRVSSAAIFLLPISVAHYMCAAFINVNSRLDVLCCVNLFYQWDAENYLGVYHNINVLGTPIDKTVCTFTVCAVIFVTGALLGAFVYARRYQKGHRKLEFKKLRHVRSLISRLLRIQNSVVNELYKLIILQKKGIVVVIFVAVVAASADSYTPANVYQSAYEAMYHMYLSNIEGVIDEEAIQYINDEQAYIEELERQMTLAMEGGDYVQYSQLETEYESRKKAFERLSAQYDKLRNADGNVYFVDEMKLQAMFGKYDRDVMIFLLTGIGFVILISGIFASDMENKMYRLSYSTVNGRRKLELAKAKCAVIAAAVLFVAFQIPWLVGYRSAAPIECLKQRLSLLYEPQINSEMTIMALLGIVILIRLLIFVVIFILTYILCRRSRSEFVSAVFMCALLIVICLVLYYMKLNLTRLILDLTVEWRQK